MLESRRKCCGVQGPRAVPWCWGQDVAAPLALLSISLIPFWTSPQVLIPFPRPEEGNTSTYPNHVLRGQD